MKRCVLAVLLFAYLAVPVQAAGPSGEEDQCTALDGTLSGGGGTISCLCSETLNANDGTITTSHNPSNSLDPYQCNNGTAISYLFGASYSFVQLSTRPGLGNLPSTNYVWRRDTDGGTMRLSDSTGQDITDATWCARQYFREGDGTPAKGDGNTGAKHVRIKGGAVNNAIDTDIFFAGTATGNLRMNHTDKNNGIGWSTTNVDPSDGDLNVIADCSTLGWCFLEFCIDHNPPGNTDRIVFRTRLWALHDDNVDEIVDVSTGTASSAVVGTDFTQIIRGRSDYSQQRHFAHVVVMRVDPADPNFWIGPATEIADAGPTWFIPSVTATPTECTQGSCGELVDLSATASGTATGTISWEKDCDQGSGWESLAGTCDDVATCNAVDACDLSAANVGTYNLGLRSTNSEGPTVASDIAAFTVHQTTIQLMTGGSSSGGSF